jgi:uncharacterized membrane protein
MDTSEQAYLPQIQKIYGFKPGTLDSIDWVLIIGGVLATLLCTVAFVYWVFKLFGHLFKARSGKAHLADKHFWRRMGFGLAIIITFMSGLLFVFLETWWNYAHRLGGFGGS